jgi:hypothetical protein
MRYIARRRLCSVLVITGCLSACDAEMSATDEVGGVSEVSEALTTVSTGTISCDSRGYAVTANTGTVTVSSGAKVDSYQLSQGGVSDELCKWKVGVGWIH